MKLILFALLFHTIGISVNLSDIAGEWTFSAPYAPAGYEKGEVHISTSEEGEYEVSIVIGSYEMPGSKVELDGDELSFVIYVEDQSIPLTLTFEGDTFTGKAETPDGDVTIEGARKEE